MTRADGSGAARPPQIIHGACLDVMRTLETCRFDAAVTDPPYGLGFQRQQWDYELPTLPELREVFRVVKPGAYLIAFSGSRTYHRLASRIEDAGFTIHPLLAWIFGTGFPKARKLDIEGLEEWRYGLQALKPALEPIVLAQKPASEASMRSNVLRWGTGALNIGQARVPVQGDSDDEDANDGAQLGRWPSNVIHDGSQQVLDAFPDAPGASSDTKASHQTTQTGGRVFNGVRKPMDLQARGDVGSAARFFYCAKPTAQERNADGPNLHPTVKPLALMRWLCSLVTPPGGEVLDPWCGSGTTGKAAVELGFGFVGIDQDSEAVETARRRVAGAQPGLPL